jgi:hypothetical protein
LQNSSEVNGDSLNNVRHETSELSRNERKEKIYERQNEFETNRKNV